jgi:hypothetical protein
VSQVWNGPGNPYPSQIYYRPSAGSLTAERSIDNAGISAYGTQITPANGQGPFDVILDQLPPMLNGQPTLSYATEIRIILQDLADYPKGFAPATLGLEIGSPNSIGLCGSGQRTDNTNTPVTYFFAQAQPPEGASAYNFGLWSNSGETIVDPKIMNQGSTTTPPNVKGPSQDAGLNLKSTPMPACQNTGGEQSLWPQTKLIYRVVRAFIPANFGTPQSKRNVRHYAASPAGNEHLLDRVAASTGTPMAGDNAFPFDIDARTASKFPQPNSNERKYIEVRVVIQDVAGFSFGADGNASGVALEAANPGGLCSGGIDPKSSAAAVFFVPVPPGAKQPVTTDFGIIIKKVGPKGRSPYRYIIDPKIMNQGS